MARKCQVCREFKGLMGRELMLRSHSEIAIKILNRTTRCGNEIREGDRWYPLIGRVEGGGMKGLAPRAIVQGKEEIRKGEAWRQCWRQAV
ncbi:MAG: hypothetical protein DCC75_03230 [Proteobacteria bacterium]|nr:MAG: hypothetical protein DCC75_03230 [Pseudomonadota bacterium]